MPVAADLVILISAILIIGAVLAALRLFAESDDKAGRFERCYATVSARITEGLFWLIRHLWESARRSSASERALPAAFAGLVVVTTALIPAAAIKFAQQGELQRHGVAAAVGALIWGCLLEGATLQARTKELARREVWPVRLWQAGVALAAIDLALVLVGLLHHFAFESLGAGLSGAAFVAGADLVSFLLGFVLCPWEPYPLLDP